MWCGRRDDGIRKKKKRMKFYINDVTGKKDNNTLTRMNVHILTINRIIITTMEEKQDYIYIGEKTKKKYLFAK